MNRNSALVALCHASYNRLMNVREAKDFLVDQAAKQAAIEGIPLSDLEKRMMYFTESTDATEDPIALNEQFSAHYDSDAFELKIRQLLNKAHRRIKAESPGMRHAWNAAVRELGKGDHYLLVMLHVPPTKRGLPRWMFTAAIVLGLVALISLRRFVFDVGSDSRRAQPAPIDKYLPTLSPATQHVLFALFLLIVVFAISWQLASNSASSTRTGIRKNRK